MLLKSIGFSALLVAGLGCSGGTGAASDDSASSGPRPNVILVSLDTCRADRLSPYEGGSYTSPYLAEFAKEAVVFTDCIAQSSNTGPSHRSLFTGQYPHRHQHTTFQYARSPYMMAGLLKGAGYDTAGFAGGGFLDGDLGFGQGFDTYTCKNDEGDTPTRRGFRSILPQAERWLIERGTLGTSLDDGKNNPYFLFLHTYDIHCPYWPKPKYREQFSPDYEGPLDLRTLCGREDFDQLFTAETELGAGDISHLRNMYDGGIAMTDDMFGAFMHKLRDSGELENSIVVITSDHGESLGEHDWVGHNHMWEEQLRVPLMIRFPNAAHAGKRINAPTMLVDILPTVLNQLDLPIPPAVQGESLLPYIGGEKDGASRMRVAEYLNFFSFRFNQRWKAIVEVQPDNRVKTWLFDLDSDPGETTNLANTEAGGPRLDQMIARFQQFRSQTAEADARYKGFELGSDVSSELAAELDELGYSGFDD